MEHQIQNLRIRVERLEAQSRRIRLIAGAVVVVLSVLLVAGQTSVKQSRTSRVVEAEEFILRDKNGKKRGYWRVAGGDVSSMFALLNSEERTMALLTEQDTSSRLIVWNSRGAFASLAAWKESTSVKLSGPYKLPSSEWLMGSDGRVIFALREDISQPEEKKEQWEKVKELWGEDWQALRDEMGLAFETKHRALLSTGPKGTTLLTLYDGKGNTRILITVMPDGSPSIVLYDDKGKRRAVLGTAHTISRKTGVKHEHPESSLLLHDKDGNVIFQAP